MVLKGIIKNIITNLFGCKEQYQPSLLNITKTSFIYGNFFDTSHNISLVRKQRKSSHTRCDDIVLSDNYHNSACLVFNSGSSDYFNGNDLWVGILKK